MPYTIKPQDITATDVVFGRGCRLAKHTGNLIFRRITWSHRHLYVAKFKDRKNVVVKMVAGLVKRMNGRFLEKDPNSRNYREASILRTNEKVSQALREKKHKTPRYDATLKQIIEKALVGRSVSDESEKLLIKSFEQCRSAPRKSLKNPISFTVSMSEFENFPVFDWKEKLDLIKSSNSESGPAMNSDAYVVTPSPRSKSKPRAESIGLAPESLQWSLDSLLDFNLVGDIKPGEPPSAVIAPKPTSAKSLFPTEEAEDDNKSVMKRSSIVSNDELDYMLDFPEEPALVEQTSVSVVAQCIDRLEHRSPVTVTAFDCEVPQAKEYGDLLEGDHDPLMGLLPPMEESGSSPLEESEQDWVGTLVAG